MYQCKNCGGALHFDISSQMVQCKYCNSVFFPYAVKEEEDAIESDYFGTTVYTCKQCGGEIYSVDEEAASFCSFCGSPAIMTKRISHKLRPDYIIPFKLTKSDCKKVYAKKVRYSFFTPKELRDPKYLEEFRGIYMPYWNYKFTQEGPFNFKTIRKSDQNAERIMEYFNCSVYLDSYFAGFSNDASSNFYDNISEVLGPYDMEESAVFMPSYLLGFYADTADVPSSVYVENTRDYCVQETCKALASHVAAQDRIVYDKYSVEEALKARTLLEKVDRVMYPVWFLTYRNNDRVAYVTVNGQTGKVVADMPVSVKKFFGTSLMGAIPIYFLLFFFIMPYVSIPVLMLNATMMSALFISIYRRDLQRILIREHNEGDLGLLSVKKIKKAKVVQSQLIKGDSFLILIYLLSPVLLFFLEYNVYTVISIISSIFSLALSLNGMTINAHLITKRSVYGFLFEIIAMFACLLVTVSNPMAQYPYYMIMMLTAFANMYLILEIIRTMNILATRELPQNSKIGGDHRALE